MWSTAYYWLILMKRGVLRQIFKNPHIKFHENPSGRSWVVTYGRTDGQTWRSWESLFTILRTRLKIHFVPRSKHSHSVINTSQLTLYREIIAVCSEIHTEHINILCGQNVEVLNVGLGATKINYRSCSGFVGLGVSALAFGTQVRGFKPGRSRRIFQGEKILTAPSCVREVKPWVQCRWFTACKRSLGVSWKSASRQN
jgi:hypothetical protein